jgi:tRNA (guanine-N7-)-methyltransferase
MKEGRIDHIRSFALRQGRFTIAQRDAWERLSAAYCLSMSAEPLDLPVIFPKAEGYVLEIGFGMGEALVELAKSDPKAGFVGVEVHMPGVGRLLMEIEKNSLSNIRIVRDDAVDVVTGMIPDLSLMGIHVFFPDPWPKKRHRKRRLLQTAFVLLLCRKLLPGGYLYAATDWEDYAEQISEAALAAGLIPLDREQENLPVLRPETSFEKKGRVAGRPIFDLCFRKK